ncbi:spore coat protein CotZ [Jeotgalibacillus sp. S-D1]|uniref:CotY/CotZ family spore coat protein n=1 Tax=Jeotgalibacillus sp. S-D1 TaxID=2552189 RepID=UPI001059AC15|nr:CotY/CotZ family spore coat protein [Jeotgalibacillus sp. S-D1]TDL35299.1 spore coat protein CotZ [Jeotgalibacillus sp. S-D1]
MSCCGKNDSVRDFESCVCEVVRAIKDIQDAEVECPPCLTSCFLEPLGDLTSPSRRHPADTRVFVLKTKDGSPFHAFFHENHGKEHGCISIYFRVEDIFDNCCATLRVLKPVDKERDTVNLFTDCGSKLNLSKLCKVDYFEATDSCITVDLKCFCAVQCIKDVYLDICD